MLMCNLKLNMILISPHSTEGLWGTARLSSRILSPPTGMVLEVEMGLANSHFEPLPKMIKRAIPHLALFLEL